MSRSALWRQEGNFKEREERAEEIFREACAEGRRRANAIPLWGPDDSFHFNPLLLRNTIQSAYFQKCCTSIKDWNAAIDEIYYEVKNLQPFQLDKSPRCVFVMYFRCVAQRLIALPKLILLIPSIFFSFFQSSLTSTAFCLLLRLLTMRMTAHQMNLTLKHVDSPYIRGIGFLYLRYAGPPTELWQWIQPYLFDEELFQLETKASSRITMGEFVRKLFTDREYLGTPLPRLPVGVERELQVKLLQAEKVEERAKLHFKNSARMSYFQKLGSEVMALYGDDENPIQWYRAVVDRVILRDDESGAALKYPRFVVTFPEYGNTEIVMLGELDVVEGNWRHEKLNSEHRHSGTAPRGKEWDEKNLYDEVRRRERETVTAERGWARRPPAAKTSLAQRVRQPVDSVEPPPRRTNYTQEGRGFVNTSIPTQVKHQERKRNPDELAAIAEKKQKLFAKYG